ncbi:FAD-dependent 5-carboxymethylaminomethyl-2-thiouridine(34) oxidoreductase MnmC [Pelomonas sp. SE-A7]|uniref:FAD-dependent 5-carboxymethylaminomethyl-2-thiouridine(34) oxidoreductase MnmC n=1 Tax=Pelomonas sp. SE-A7 TaxID=3054953 RepID=UPI00259CB9D9|nr:FAD-dependent 5-carboxymethylaminomethyl-2-thiouridine(34) oxidoreductase MnmC [Pelomonas sp. SE-A7]MDM4765484.1 FAD-dependent 5-carboxymethylaminomethyl-2-thiouridine(34) oxidoreductase MnmC [Pelomonas sp. SE-A7]
MKSGPIVPAQVDFSEPGVTRAPDFDDVYHSKSGAFDQARHVFLAGNGLPQRWQGRASFVMLETGFGLGNNFLAAWQAWRDDPQRSERLVFISIEKHPLRREDLARAHAHSPAPELAAALIERWPPLTHNLHGLDFDGGRVRLLLALGDVRPWLGELVAEVDAFVLDGFAPAQNPAMWDAHTLKRLARLAAPGATAASWCTAGPVKQALRTAGFEVKRRPGLAPKWHMCSARFAPRHAMHKPAGREPLAREAREVLVVGAGLAGAACAWALRRQGMACTVLEANPGPAQEASGNPLGLFHGTLNPDDGIHARFNRAAALAMAAALEQMPELPGRQHGLLRLELQRSVEAMRQQVGRLGLPPDYVQALAASDAAHLSGLPLQQPAWFYPGGGALPPALLVEQWLQGARLISGRSVTRVERNEAGQWLAFDAQGQLMATAPAIVLAGGHAQLPLLQRLAPELPLVRQRGQLTHLAQASPLPKLPVAGLGYAIADGHGGLFCGATTQDGDEEPALREADQAYNLDQWARLAALEAPPQGPLAGRVSWRLMAPDRLPLVGGLPMAGYEGRDDQPRLLPRVPGLVLCTGFASRGISWAALCGQVAASLLSGAPLPLEASLLDAIDPARFAVRRSRRQTT